MSKNQHTAGSLAIALDAVVEGPDDLICTGVATLEHATEGDITFMVSQKYAKQWGLTGASIGIIQKEFEVSDYDTSNRALLRVDNAEIAMALVLELFNTDKDLPAIGIHDSATIDPTAMIGKDVRCGPNVVVGAHATIGDSASLCNNVTIGKHCSIGANTVLRAGVTVEYDCIIGNECILYANVIVGSDGFGYCPNADVTGLLKLHHIGNVVIGDRVEIGANSCIDRGKFLHTTIGNGTKLDNLVQVGHNVNIGENSVIAAGTGIGGSVEIGSWVQIGAQVGIAPHCKVGDGVKIGAKSGLMHDIPPGEQWLGVPAGKMKDVLRQWATTRKMPGILAQFARSKKQ